MKLENLLFSSSGRKSLIDSGKYKTAEDIKKNLSSIEETNV